MGPGASGMVQLVMHRVLAPLCALVLVSIPLTKPVVASGLPEPTAWMPSTASFIAYVDTASLFSSSIFSGLEQDLSSQVGQKDLEEFRELTGMDPWRDFDAISVFTETPENERERWGLAISGAFDPERVIDTLEERGPVRRLEHRETLLYIVGALTRSTTPSDQPHALAFPDSGTALFGPVESVRSMLDVGFGWAPSADAGQLEHVLRSVSMGETFWMVSTAEDALEAELRSRVVEGLDFPAFEALLISIRLGSDIAVHARAGVESSEEARRLADVVRGFAAFSTFSEGGTPSIESLEVRTPGKWLEVDFEIDSDNVREWLRRRRKKAESSSP